MANILSELINDFCKPLTPEEKKELEREDRILMWKLSIGLTLAFSIFCGLLIGLGYLLGKVW